MVDTNGGTDGVISDISDATRLLDGTTASGAFIIAANVTASRTVINMVMAGRSAATRRTPTAWRIVADTMHRVERSLRCVSRRT